MTDPDLFSAYLATRSADAFRQLVDRHLPLVYAAALRQLRDQHLAEDATQAVFLVFIKKAKTIRTGAILPAWLLTTTRYVCQDARKLALRRQLHEQKAAVMSQSATAPALDITPDYSAITPHLDDALATLPESDRAAIILRYFDSRPLKEVGTALQISEPAAQKRLERALQKLRAFFAGRNIALSAATLPAALAVHASPAALPPALAATIAAANTSTASSAAALALAKSTLHALFWSPAKIAAAAVAVLATSSLIAMAAAASPRTQPVAIAASHTASASQPANAPAASVLPGVTATQASNLPPQNATMPAQQASAELTDHFSDKIQQALGIQDTGVDIVPALANAVSKTSAAPSAAADSLNLLVAELLKGPHPSALVDQMLPFYEVGATSGPYDSPAWKFGTMLQRDNLGGSMWKLARAAYDADPKKSRDLARAALMLAALGDMNQGWFGLATVENEPAESQKLLGMTDVEFAPLAKLVHERGHRDYVRSQEVLHALEGIDAITKSPVDTVELHDVTAILQHLDNAFRQGVPQMGNRWEIIRDAWWLQNLLKTRFSKDSQAAVRRQLETWQKDFPDPNIDKWITQALTREGDPPPELVGH